jgi:hypothetical protein
MNPVPANTPAPVATAELPSELHPVLARLGPGLVAVHFSYRENNHPIFGSSRGGNVAGRISRELVAAAAGFHAETVRFENHTTILYRTDDPPRAVTLLQLGLKRCGLAACSQVFSVDQAGALPRHWPAPLALKPRAKTISPDSVSPKSYQVTDRIWARGLCRVGRFLQRIKAALHATPTLGCATATGRRYCCRPQTGPSPECAKSTGPWQAQKITTS